MICAMGINDLARKSCEMRNSGSVSGQSFQSIQSGSFEPLRNSVTRVSPLRANVFHAICLGESPRRYSLRPEKSSSPPASLCRDVW